MTPIEELKRIGELKILNGGEWDRVHATLPDLVRAVEAAQRLEPFLRFDPDSEEFNDEYKQSVRDFNAALDPFVSEEKP